MSKETVADVDLGQHVFDTFSKDRANYVIIRGEQSIILVSRGPNGTLDTDYTDEDWRQATTDDIVSEIALVHD